MGKEETMSRGLPKEDSRTHIASSSFSSFLRVRNSSRFVTGT